MSNTHHSITYSTAVDYILRFITKYRGIASTCFGGFIDKTTLETILENNSTDNLYGLHLWYCYNDDDHSELPLFFISLTDKDNFDEENPPSAMDMAKDYYMASSIHKFNVRADTGHLESYLENTDYTNSMEDAIAISASDASVSAGKYANDFPLADDTSDCRANPCGLFIQEDTGINDLISDESCIGMNYYFGISDGEVQKICVILFPVDDTGFNATDRLIFEKAFP